MTNKVSADKVLDWIVEDLLDEFNVTEEWKRDKLRVKQQLANDLLGLLPKERSTYAPTDYGLGNDDGFNEALSQVETIIREYFGVSNHSEGDV